MNPNNIFYSYSFKPNEAHANQGVYQETHYYTEYTPVVPGSVTGQIHMNDAVTHTFCVMTEGAFTFNPVAGVCSDAQPTWGQLNWPTGQLTLSWSRAPGPHQLVFNYEYEEQIDNPFDYTVTKRDTNFELPSFNTFFTSEEISELVRDAGTSMTVDFNTMLGETIKEKSESLYVKCVELTNVLVKKGAVGYFWMVCSPEVTSIFETATAGFAPVSYDLWRANNNWPSVGVNPMGLSKVSYRGSVNLRWRLYADTEIPSDIVLIGCNDRKEDASHYGRMRIANFII